MLICVCGEWVAPQYQSKERIFAHAKYDIAQMAGQC